MSYIHNKIVYVIVYCKTALLLFLINKNLPSLQMAIFFTSDGTWMGEKQAS